MTTVLLSSASSTLPMVSRDSCHLGPLACTLGSSLIISSAYQNEPTEVGNHSVLCESHLHNGMNDTLYLLRPEAPRHQPSNAEDLAHLKFDNSARYNIPRLRDSIHSLYQTKLIMGGARLCRQAPTPPQTCFALQNNQRKQSGVVSTIVA